LSVADILSKVRRRIVSHRRTASNESLLVSFTPADRQQWISSRQRCYIHQETTVDWWSEKTAVAVSYQVCMSARVKTVKKHLSESDATFSKYALWWALKWWDSADISTRCKRYRIMGL